MPQHLSAVELEQCIPDVLASPPDVGRLEAIVVRPAVNERRTLESATLTLAGGIDGDRWATEKGSPDPRSQVSIMNFRYLRHIAVSEDAICLAGDNLVVDLELSEANLPAGSRLAIGDEVILEITNVAHTGCSKFERRYGKETRTFTNNPRGKELHLRGRYAQIVTGGTIHTSDPVRKL